MKGKILAILLCVTIVLIALTANTLADNDAGLAGAGSDAVLFSVANEWYATVPGAGSLTVADNKLNYCFDFCEAGTYFLGLQKGFTGQLKFVSFAPALPECEHINTTLMKREATCTVEGFEWLYCNDCQDYIDDIRYFPALDHVPDKRIPFAGSSCLHSGGDHIFCSVCDEYLGIETNGIPGDHVYCDGGCGCCIVCGECECPSLLDQLNDAIGGAVGTGPITITVDGVDYVFTSNSGNYNGNGSLFCTVDGVVYRLERNKHGIIGIYIN